MSTVRPTAPAVVVESAGPTGYTTSKELRRLVRFAALGALNTAVGVLLLAALVLGLGVPYVAAQAATHFVVVTAAYVPSSRWVFGDSSPSSLGLLKFHGSYLVQLAVSLLILIAMIEVWSVPLVPAQLVSVFAAAVTSFLVQRHFVFSIDHQVDQLDTVP